MNACGEARGRGYTAQTRRRTPALCFRRSPATIKRGADLHRSGANLPPQIYSAFIRCNTLYLAMQGVCQPFPLDSLKGCGGAEAIYPIASASLQPYGSFRHKHTRSLSLICRVEVDNILTFGSNVSLRNGQVYPLLPPPRPPFSRRRLCICGGSHHISDDTAAAVFGW